MSFEMNKPIDLHDGRECDDDDDDDDDEDYKPENCNSESDFNNESDDNECNNTDDMKKKHSKRRNSKKKRINELNDNEEKCEKIIELNENEQKQRNDDLWAQFCSDLPQSSKPILKDNTDSVHTSTKCESKVSDNNSKIIVNKVYDFAGESVTIAEEIDDSKSNKQLLNNEKNSIKSTNQLTSIGTKRSSGLSNIMEQLKKPKMSTLNKSVLDWKEFKKSEGIEEELTKHTKSKDAFVERMAFLQRTDVRQFEIEKDIRAKKRLQNQLNKS